MTAKPVVAHNYLIVNYQISESVKWFGNLFHHRMAILP